METHEIIPRILKINEINGYKVSCLFNNGESRIVDFEAFFKHKRYASSKHPAYKLIQDKNEFDKLEVLNNTIAWQNTGIYSTDVNGNQVFYHYDVDPIVLFKASRLDEKRNILIGQLIKQAREESGLSQSELALKSGTKKSDISKLESNQSNIELLTLKKIVEIGLEKKLTIQIS